MKKLLVAALAVSMTLSICACGSATYTKTTTTTTTTTDADGNTTSTTTTTTSSSGYAEGSCGAACEDGDTHTVDVSIDNETGADITGLYMCIAGETEWTNLFDEDEVLEDGQIAEDYIAITYSADALSYDLGIKDADGEMHEFDDIDISDLDENGFTITITADGDSYSWTIDASYVK